MVVVVVVCGREEGEGVTEVFVGGEEDAGGEEEEEGGKVGHGGTGTCDCLLRKLNQVGVPK